MNVAIPIAVLASGVGLAVPLLWAALGEAINEQAGIINVGTEGVMLIGAFGAAASLHFTNSLYIGVFGAIASGMLAGATLAYLYINRSADQIVTGILFNLFALGLTAMLYEAILKTITYVPTFSPLPIPGMSGIPILGPALFRQQPLGYGAFLMAPVAFYLLRKTWLGLYLRSLGERPAAADAAGLSVSKLRWSALLIGTSLVGLGGGALVMDISGNFIPGITNGQGFIAVGIVMLCRWKPFVIIAGSLMFGLATALQFQFQFVQSLRAVPSEVWLALPYLIAIIAISISRRSGFPRAAGIPYRREGISV